MENNKTKRQTQHSGSGGSSGGKMHYRYLFLGDTLTGKKVSLFLDGIAFSIFITLVTIITLFADDFRKIFFTVNSDVNFSILTLFCMTVYTVEIIMLSFVKEGYFLRFYFWLDLISTVTMILDLSWINDLLSGSGGIQAATSVVKIARASRVSKIGARSMKLIRLLRLIRILKLYRNVSKQLQKQNQNEGQIDSDNRPKLNMKTDEVKNQNIKPDENKKRVSGNQSANGKHQVSLKNITFEGAHRRQSALHPSQKLSHKFESIKNFDDGINQLPASPNHTGEKQRLRRVSKLKLDYKTDHKPLQGISEQNVMVPTHKDNNVKKESMQVGSSGSGSNFDLPHQTKVSLRLKDEIQKNLIAMILLILISIPVLNVDTWFDHTTIYEKSVKELEFFSKQGSTIFDAYAPVLISELVTKTNPLVYFTVPVNTTCCEFPRDYPQYINKTKTQQQMRGDERNVMANDDGSVTTIFDETSVEIFAAQLNIGLTLFVCVLLISMVIVFIHDVEVEALEPLENMINTVKKISENPLNAITQIQRQNLIKLSIQSGNYDSSIKTEQELLALIKQEKKKNETEPVVLENLIVKIGSLLAVGFGQAGTQLIGKNIQSYGSLNVMMPGKKVICIFGFCDIRNFTDATQILQAKVMLFVNEIAEICHDVVNKVGGNPNKNIGDAFLLVWKFKEEDTISVANNHQSNLQLQSSLKVRQTADLAVFSFIKMIAEIARSQNLQKYKNNEKLKKRIKNYEGVKMGFGLHVGWAIQGPIGSQFKIDASYLGANVNMSGRLQAATKHYGVPMLISGSLYQLMTLKNKQHLRHIDRVEVKTGEKPMDLYTVDVSVQNLINKRGINPKKKNSALQKKKAKVHHNLNRDKLLTTIQKKRVSSQIWNDDKDVQALTQPFTADFYNQWKKGFDAYLKGDWKQAVLLLTKTEELGLNGHDGPSQVILDIMKERNFEVPEGWNGTTPFAG